MKVSREVILYTLTAINFVHIIDVMIMMPLGDIFMREFGIGSAAFSLLVSVYSIGAFISTLIGVFILDRFDRKKVLLIVLFGFTIGSILCGFADNYLALLAFRFITGSFGGMLGAIALSIISDLYLFEERGRAMGILMAAFSLASAIGVPFGLILAELISWHAPFIVAGILGGILWLVVLGLFPPIIDHIAPIEQRVNKKDTILAITSDPNQMNALLLGMILVFGHFIIIPFITPYMIRNVGFTQTDVIYIYLVGGIATAFTSPLFGRLTDRIGAIKLFKILVVISFIPVIAITHMPKVSVPVALIATGLFFVLASGRMIPPQTLITATAKPGNRGSFMSVKAALQQLAVAVASILAGLIITDNADNSIDNYNWVGYVSIVALLIAFVIVPRLKVAEGN